MEIFTSFISLILFVSILVMSGSHAEQSPQDYWKSVLPNTRMPKAVHDILLHPFAELIEDKNASATTNGKGSNEDPDNAKPGGDANSGSNDGPDKVNPGGDANNGSNDGPDKVNPGGDANDGSNNGPDKVKPGGDANNGSNDGSDKEKPGGVVEDVIVGQNGVGVKAKDKSGKQTTVGVGKGGILVNTIHKGKPIFVGVKPGPSPFVYFYGATAEQLQDHPNKTTFFLEKDLNRGTNMNLHFTKTTNQQVIHSFLPRKVADSIPFSSTKFPEILNLLNDMTSDSINVDVMKQTIKECEEPAIKGEEKYCATSLESMVDFATSKLGKRIQAFSTDVSTDQSNSQEFTITRVTKITDNSKKAVLCHKEKYPYAVFYCHMTLTTKAYMVFLAGADGARAKAFVACHTDTSAWNPKHLAFQVLNVKPGDTVPVCHFLPEDHVVWVQN